MNTTRTIRVEGTGVASFAPDTIEIMVNLEQRNLDYAKTMELAARALEILTWDMAKIDYPATKIITQNFHIDSVYNSERDNYGNYTKKFEGYLCAQTIKLTLDYDMAYLSEMIKTLGESEAKSDFNIHFTIKDNAAAIDETLKNAVADAKHKAEILAQAAGVTLQEIVEIISNPSGINRISNTEYKPYNARDGVRCMSAKAIDIIPEDIKSSQNVQVIWNIN